MPNCPIRVIVYYANFARGTTSEKEDNNTIIRLHYLVQANIYIKKLQIGVTCDLITKPSQYKLCISNDSRLLN